MTNRLASIAYVLRTVHQAKGAYPEIYPVIDALKRAGWPERPEVTLLEGHKGTRVLPRPVEQGVLFDSDLTPTISSAT